MSPVAAYPASVGIVSSWLRALIGASGVTLLVPAGLLAAVLVAATVGGSGLGSVGQLIGGPEVPGVSESAPESANTLPTVPVRGADRATTTAPASATQRAASRRRAAQRRQGSGGSSRTTQQATKGPTTTGATPPPAPPATGTTPPPPPPPPAPERNPVRRIGNAVKDLVRPLPIVGPPVADAVGTVIDLIAPPGGQNAVSETVGKVLGAK